MCVSFLQLFVVGLIYLFFTYLKFSSFLKSFFIGKAYSERLSIGEVFSVNSSGKFENYLIPERIKSRGSLFPDALSAFIIWKKWKSVKTKWRALFVGHCGEEVQFLLALVYCRQIITHNHISHSKIKFGRITLKTWISWNKPFWGFFLKKISWPAKHSFLNPPPLTKKRKKNST